MYIYYNYQQRNTNADARTRGHFILYTLQRNVLSEMKKNDTHTPIFISEIKRALPDTECDVSLGTVCASARLHTIYSCRAWCLIYGKCSFATNVIISEFMALRCGVARFRWFIPGCAIMETIPPFERRTNLSICVSSARAQ